MSLTYLKLDLYLGSDVSATSYLSLLTSNAYKSHLSISLLAFKEPSVKGKCPLQTTSETRGIWNPHTDMCLVRGICDSKSSCITHLYHVIPGSSYMLYLIRGLDCQNRIRTMAAISLLMTLFPT